jgi:hypothetical protein
MYHGLIRGSASYRLEKVHVRAGLSKNRARIEDLLALTSLLAEDDPLYAAT